MGPPRRRFPSPMKPACTSFIATSLDGGQKLREVLAAAEREGLLLIDRGATPASYRATYALERQVTLFAAD